MARTDASKELPKIRKNRYVTFIGTFSLVLASLIPFGRSCVELSLQVKTLKVAPTIETIETAEEHG